MGERIGAGVVTPQISLRGVGVRVGARYLLRDVSWNIGEGSRWVVLGSNGSGKTTLLSLIAACSAPSTGSIAWEGVPYENFEALRLRQRVGFVSSSWFGRIYNHESVADIMLSGTSGTFGADFPNPLATPVGRMRRLLSLIDLAEKEDMPFSSLSRGQQQMILILRALMAHPSILVLDELTAGLDVMARQTMRLLVREIATQRSHTLVYVTHYFEEISPADFDSVLLLKRGAVFAQGALEEVMTQDVLSSFLGHSVKLGQDASGAYSLRFSTERGSSYDNIA